MIYLTLPLPPNAANARRNWRVALKQKKAYWAHLNMLQGRLYRPTEPLNPAHIAVRYHVWNLMDDDNAMHRAKPLLDWLKGVYIVDDSRKHLVWDRIPEQVIDRKNPRVIVALSREVTEPFAKAS